MKKPARPLLLITISTTVLLSACKEAPKAEAWQDIRQVKLFTVPVSNSSQLLTLPGEVHAGIDTPLAFRVSGKVIKKQVVLGSQIKAGQLLAELDASDYVAGNQAANAQVAAASAEQQQNSKDLARYKNLMEKGFISPAEFERRKTLLATSNAQLNQTIANAKTSQNQTGYTQLRAAHDGQISDWQLEVGQVIAAGQVVGKLAAKGQPTLWVSVPETRLASFQSATALQVKINALGSAPFTGQLIELSPQADSATRTFTAKIRLSDSTRAVAGMSGEVSLPINSAQQVMQIPLAAVFNNGASGNGVWIYEPAKKKVRFTKVTLGDIHQDQVIVRQGLQAGQQIVAAGANLIHEGQSVKPAEGI